MQFPTTPVLAAAVEEHAPPDVGTLGVAFAIVLGAAIFGNLTASLLVARSHATVGRAALTVLLQIALSIGFGLLGLLIVIFLGAAMVDRELVILAIVLAGVLYLIFSVSIPMRVYEIGVFPSIVFLILSAIAGGVVQTVATRAMVGNVDFKQLSQRFEGFADRIKKSNSPAPDETAELERRKEELMRRREQLEIRRKYLPPGDRAALAEFERDRAAFDRDVEQFRADGGQ